MDTGLAIVIGAVLIFYLRLIILQRERAKRLAQAPEPAANTRRKKKQAPRAPDYSILSKNPADRLVAGMGAVLILVGVLLFARLIPVTAAQPYWWIPTAVGILAFSWAFKL